MDRATSPQPCGSAAPSDVVCGNAPANAVPASKKRRHQRHKNTERFAELIAFLMKRPRSAEELCAVAEISRRSYDSVLRILDALRAEGCVHILEWHTNRCGRPTAIYAWQKSVFALPDAPAPVARPRGRRTSA